MPHPYCGAPLGEATRIDGRLPARIRQCRPCRHVLHQHLRAAETKRDQTLAARRLQRTRAAIDRLANPVPGLMARPGRKPPTGRAASANAAPRSGRCGLACRRWAATTEYARARGGSPICRIGRSGSAVAAGRAGVDVDEFGEVDAGLGKQSTDAPDGELLDDVVAVYQPGTSRYASAVRGRPRRARRRPGLHGPLTHPPDGTRQRL